MLAQEDGDVAHEGYEGHDTAYYVLPLEVILSLRVQIRIVSAVVVAFRQELRLRSSIDMSVGSSPAPQALVVELKRNMEHLPIAELPHDPVDDWDILVLHIVYHYLSNLLPVLSVIVDREDRAPGGFRTSVSCTQFLFHRRRRSPRWKAGSMLPLRTTTIGDGESVRTERPFHI
jgi:hypothetical protein